MPDPADFDTKALLAFFQQGNVSFPRYLIWPIVHSDCGWDYSHLGQLVILLAEGTSVTSDGLYIPRVHPEYAMLRTIAEKLFAVDLVGQEETASGLNISLQPLVYRATMAWRDAGEPMAYRHPGELAEAATAAATDSYAPLSNITREQLEDAVQRIFTRPLSQMEFQELRKWNEDVGVSCSVILFVLEEYRSSLSAKDSVNWRTFRGWVRRYLEKNVRTVEEYKEAKENHERLRSRYRRFLEEMGLRGMATESQQEAMTKWQVEWTFEDDMIVRACAMAFGKDNPVMYADAILKRWHARGIKTVQEAEAAEESWAESKGRRERPLARAGRTSGSSPAPVPGRTVAANSWAAQGEPLVNKWVPTKKK